MAPAEGTDPVLTDRLLLTPIGIEHSDDLERLYSDPLVDHWTGPWTPLDVRAWAQDMADRWASDGVGKWVAHDRSDGTLVGRGGLSRVVLGDKTVLEVGWVVRDELTGRGYASEIGRAALGWAATFFPDFPVVAFTEVHNLASVAVMRRLGLESSGVIYREGLVEGQPGLHARAPFALYRQVPTDRASP
ncbi:N-acetyltransferase [Desertihabitans brevis]|uniref:N-acetyltransferase n=1 Tax=Desertihabitans brevis TaxID=2268447 RepID=A0A367YUJ4_9ACTN|nr:GNAT family N-acetyltransferase [Desertihabitans brevis]RCK68641.1 N-acetyltransferase [Desertihabitans brevis]